MTLFGKALATLMFSMIAREVPALRADPQCEEARTYRADIEKMVEIDAKVASGGKLVNPHIDRLLLGAVRFYEARFHSKPSDGDCRWKHPEISYDVRCKYSNSRGLVPEWLVRPKRICAATGPMQISKGNRYIAPAFAEIRYLFRETRAWHCLVQQGVDPWSVGRRDSMSVDELRVPATNVLFGYGLLWHWKVESNQALPQNETRSTPPGVWLTAYGWGKVPPINAKTVRYVDREGRRRCELATKWMHELAEIAKKPDAGFSFDFPEGWYCGHESYAMPAEQ